MLSLSLALQTLAIPAMATAVSKQNGSISHELSSDELEGLSPKQVRQEFRRNTKRITSMSGLCGGHIQTGVFILHSSLADSFEQFCRENTSAFPLVYRAKAGEVEAPEFVEDLDIR